MKEAVFGIKKLIKRITVIAGIMTVLMFSSCKDSFEALPEQPGMAKVVINIMSNGGRGVVQPNLPKLSEITKFELLGGVGEDEETSLIEFNGPNNAWDSGWSEENIIYLKPGDWHFILNAYINDQIRLQGKIEQGISAETPNMLNFFLSPLNSVKGAISITFTFPESAGIIRVTANSDGNGLLSQEWSPNFNKNVNGENVITYDKYDIPADDYYIIFRFYNGNGEQVRVFSELVKVRSNLTSSKQIEIKTYTVFAKGDKLADKLQWIKYNYPQDNIEYIVEVDEGGDLPPNVLSYGENVIVTLRGMGTENRTISLKGDSKGSLFTVGSGVTLVLGDKITLQGHPNNNAPLVMIDRGTLEMNAGSKITGNNGADFGGGGVSMNGGTFTMSGGEIFNNTAEGYGNGVSVNGGTFTMSGGDIYDNFAEYYCNGVSVNGGTFTMSGGNIYNNGNDGSGVYVLSGGIFTMSGGKIYSHYDGCGVKVNGGEFTMSNGEISDNKAQHGGGVSVVNDGTFTMSGGTISGNTARQGGGVSVDNGIFTMSGGTISGNTAIYNDNSYGGGVCVGYNGTFTKTEGGTIFGFVSGAPESNEVENIPTGDHGHAVYVGSEPAKHRESNAGLGIILDSRISGGDGGWAD